MVGGPVPSTSRGAASEAPTACGALHALKTGRLIAASVGVRTASWPAGAEPETIASAGSPSELGVLFQIVDDILDVTGDGRATLGKPPGSDERLRQAHLREHIH